jgi:uncharacterized DUF497 family protein
MLQFDFGPGNDATNLSKHGHSLLTAAELSWDKALVWSHDRADNGQNRVVVLGPMADILFSVAFVERKPGKRLISLRRANHCEFNHYVKAIKEELPQDADA